MLTFILFTALSMAPSAPSAPSEEAAPSAKTDNPNWQCATGRNRLKNQESRETWDQIKAMKKDGGAGIPPEAQKILNDMTAFYEQDNGRTSSDTAEMLREFAGGKAERKTAC
jgi:hypothetical protein